MTAALTAPMVDAAQNDDSNILAVVVQQGGRIRTWITPSAGANSRILMWCTHALDDGRHIATFTMADLMALPPIG